MSYGFFEPNAEGSGTWMSGLALSPEEKSEQEYLMALSAQYQVEHYDDCYNLTGQWKKEWLHDLCEQGDAEVVNSFVNDKTEQSALIQHIL